VKYKKEYFYKKKIIIYGTYSELVEYSKALPKRRRLVKRTRQTDSGSADASNKTKKRRPSNLYASRQKLIRLVYANTNQVWSGREFFITLKFAENIRNLSQANKEYTNFIKRFNTYLGYASAYVAVPEFQKRGAVHYHCLFFNMPTYRADFTPKTLEAIWGMGRYNQGVDFQQVKSIKDSALYIAKYMTKATLDSRLVGRKTFFTSRNLKRPFEVRDDDDVDYLLMKGKTDIVYEYSRDTKYLGLINKKFLYHHHGKFIQSQISSNWQYPSNEKEGEEFARFRSRYVGIRDANHLAYRSSVQSLGLPGTREHKQNFFKLSSSSKQRRWRSRRN
jgi:hypothetical protein